MTVQNSDVFLLNRGGKAYQTPFEGIVEALPQPIWGRIEADGTARSIKGARVTRRRTGVYTVTFDQPRDHDDYPVIATLERIRANSGLIIAVLQIRAQSLRFVITERMDDGSNGTARDAGFTFYVPA